MEIIAYLDPGTGTLIVQAVLGGAAGLTMLVKSRGRRILKKGAKTDETTATEETTSPATPSQSTD